MKFYHIAIILGLFFPNTSFTQTVPTITADFKAVPSLREHLPINIPEADHLLGKQRNDLECLAWNLYFEARGGTKQEKIAVAWVPINRMNDAKFAKDICTNVFQYIQVGPHRSWQFSWAYRVLSKYFKPEPAAWVDVQRIALGVLSGQLTDPGKGALYFHHKDVQLTFTPRSGRLLLGSHYFYR